MPENARLQRLDRLAYLLDNAIRIPGTRFRFGYDALIGLVPGLGDAVGFAFSAYIVLQAARFRLPFPTLARMVTNVGVEALVGVVPFLGDVFDATWKANARNMRLLHERLEAPEASSPRSDRTFFIGLLLAFLLLLLLLGALGIWVLGLLFRAIGG